MTNSLILRTGVATTDENVSSSMLVALSVRFYQIIFIKSTMKV